MTLTERVRLNDANRCREHTTDWYLDERAPFQGLHYDTAAYLTTVAVREWLAKAHAGKDTA